MKKSGKRKSGRKRKQLIHMCCDRILTGAAKIKAMEAAILENSVNQPPAPVRSRRRFGASSMGAPLKMALEAGKKWRDGRTLGVFFVDGSATQKARVKEQAVKREALLTSSLILPRVKPVHRSESHSWQMKVHGPTSARIALVLIRQSQR